MRADQPDSPLRDDFAARARPRVLRRFRRRPFLHPHEQRRDELSDRVSAARVAGVGMEGSGRRTQPAVKLDGMRFFRDFIVVDEREDGLAVSCASSTRRPHASHRISTPEPVYCTVRRPEPRVRCGLAALRLQLARHAGIDVLVRHATPRSHAAQAASLWSVTTSTGYESKRVWIPARDGVKVPVALVYKKGTKLDGTAPMLLYAYGSYGFSIDPDVLVEPARAFSTAASSTRRRAFAAAASSASRGATPAA